MIKLIFFVGVKFIITLLRRGIEEVGARLNNTKHITIDMHLSKSAELYSSVTNKLKLNHSLIPIS